MKKKKKKKKCNVINVLNIHKSVGPNSIPTNLLKQLNNYIINKSFF